MKRVLSFVIILVMAVSLAACTGQGGNTPDPTQEPTAAPTEWSAVAKVTPEPTSAPTDEPDPTDAPKPDMDKLIEEAWALAKRVGEVHGLEFDKENREVHTNRLTGDVTVDFSIDAETSLSVFFRFDPETADWSASIGSCRLLVWINDEPDQDKWQKDHEEISWTEIEAWENDPDAAAQYAAEKISEMLTDCSRGNYFRCKEAYVVFLEKHQSAEGDRYTVRIAANPVNERYFSTEFGDILSILCDYPDYPECEAWLTIYYDLKVERTDGGYYSVTVEWLG